MTEIVDGRQRLVSLLDEQLEYWDETLDGHPAMLNSTGKRLTMGDLRAIRDALASRPQEQPRKATGEEIEEAYDAARHKFLHENDGAQFVNHAAHIEGLHAVLALSVSPAAAQGWQTAPTDEALVKHMVDRFLMWKLPTHFRPDDGISFDPISSRGTKYERRREPTGTNLFDVDQATAMVRHMLDGAPAAAPPSPDAQEQK